VYQDAQSQAGRSQTSICAQDQVGLSNLQVSLLLLPRPYSAIVRYRLRLTTQIQEYVASAIRLLIQTGLDPKKLMSL
jgi:hypothetical protein